MWVSFPRSCLARWVDSSVSPPVQESYVPPGVALLCAQGWVSPLLCWLLVVLVCDFVFFWARHGFWLVWVDERDFDVSFNGMFGASVLVFLFKRILAAAMLAAPLAAMRWSMPACSRICPPCSQSSLMLLLHAPCFAAFLWPHRHTYLVVLYSWWKKSGIGKGRGVKKAGRSYVCLGLWLFLIPFQVGISSLAAATEAAFCGILKFCGHLQPAAVAAATHGIFTLVCGISLLKFVFSLIEESCEFTEAAASVAALFSWKHGLFAAAASVGLLAFVVCYQFLVDILGSRFASVQVLCRPK